MLHHGIKFISSWRMFQHGEKIDIEEGHVTSRQVVISTVN